MREEEQRGHAEQNRTGPRIYVASLADYTSGRLHGAWIDATQPLHDIETDINEMLAASPTGAEEYGIFDYDGFGPLHVDENDPIETVARIAGGISEHGEPFAHWAGIVGTDKEALSGFNDAYWGHFDSLADCGNYVIEALGWHSRIEDAAPRMLRPFVRIDTVGFVQEWQRLGIVTTTAATGGGVYVFGVAS